MDDSTLASGISIILTFSAFLIVVGIVEAVPWWFPLAMVILLACFLGIVYNLIWLISRLTIHLIRKITTRP